MSLLPEFWSEDWVVKAPRMPQLLPKPHCTGPSWTFLHWVVSLLEGGPTSPFRAEPGRVPWAKTRPPGARLLAPTPGLAPGWGPGNANAKRAFNTIQPTLLRDKLSRMGVDPQLMDWISDYLTGRPQYVGLKDITSDTVVSSTGAPQGTVLAPLLFTLYTSDFCYNSELCHIQKYADDTAIVGCIRDDREEEYRRLVGDFAAWCHTNHLQLNTSKTKELDNKLDWTTHTSHLYGKTQSRMYFLRRLRSFNICSKLLQMFYQSVVASVLFYTVVCWGGSISKKDTSRLDKLIRRAGSVVGMKLDSLVTVAESRTLDKLLDIMDNASHPLHTVISNQRSLFSERLLLPKCKDQQA
ncbi:hypothetical protein L3Q82_011546 [Scortum barcoo]|uniref:Uncharacterized protein n=1 Tax=Scortum barcoo TaxID=214431 RepID=A0ACB8W633_9TELE|nr:hypothetical protein L3Q82_011546 [Scortum barcoo]